MAVHVRRATLADAPTIATLNAAVQAPHADAHPEVFLAPDRDAAEPEFARWLADPNWHAFVAEDAGTPIGYAAAHPVSFPANAFVRATSYLRLDQMAVLPQAEGRGVGTALVDAVVSLARELGFDSVNLSVWTFNERARRLYEKEGFEAFRVEMRAPVTPATSTGS